MDFLLQLQHILETFLGKPKRDVTDNGQLQFGCPMCAETYGEAELSKYNLEVNVRNGKFNCWKCSSTHDEMHGSITKLIKLYGNETILKEYRNAIAEFKKSKLYELHFNKEDFIIEQDAFIDDSFSLPPTYRKFDRTSYNPKKALDYLNNRGIDWDIIEKFNIGYTRYDDNNKQLSSRIVIPSYNDLGEINYWTGRDFTMLPYRQKYFNPQAERKNLIFNENKIQWDADITIVEGPFDHIVVPNSVPLLGKSLNTDFELYDKLMRQSNANINIFLDGDAFDNVVKIYKTLNHGRLYGKIKYIPVSADLDPSEIFQQFGRNGIIQHLANATHIDNVLLL